jgi:hypothetical protein
VEGHRADAEGHRAEGDGFGNEGIGSRVGSLGGMIDFLFYFFTTSGPTLCLHVVAEHITMAI